jgi:hypothetical protein
MGVDTFWKRVPGGVVADLGPRELSDLVPYWFDDRFKVEQGEGTVVGAQDTGALIFALLLAAAAGPSERAAAGAFAQMPPDWDEHYMVGTLSTDVVRQVAALLSDAPLADWVNQHRSALADEMRSLGYQRPFDDDVAGQVLEDTQQLAALFRAAAAASEAVIIKMSA